MSGMSYQSFVDAVGVPCCVLSVEKTPEGGCGRIRIMESNRAYRELMGPAYYEGMPYEELAPRDNKFEEYCFRAAILRQRMHAYVEVRAMGCWIDQVMIPIGPEGGDVGFCQYVLEMTRMPESGRMAYLPAEVSQAVLRSCITLMGAEDFRLSVGRVLEEMIEVANAMACRIVLVDDEEENVSVFCERAVEGPEHLRSLGKEVLPYDIVRSWEAAIGVSNVFLIRNAEDMEELARHNPAWAGAMEERGVRSLALIPLRRSRQVVGYMYVINFDVEKVVEVKAFLELMAFFLGSEIANYLLVRRLERISNMDVLTGLNNRRAMIRRMRELSEGGANCPCGVISIDLNGLKVVNDTEGHEAGDRLLIQAGEILKKVFYYDDLYRTGGDEFIVIIAGIDRETFGRKIRRVRRDAGKSAEVSFAIGGYWSDGTEDVAAAIRKADEEMYKDKEVFYGRNPKKRRM